MGGGGKRGRRGPPAAPRPGSQPQRPRLPSNTDAERLGCGGCRSWPRGRHGKAGLGGPQTRPSRPRTRLAARGGRAPHPRGCGEAGGEAGRTGERGAPTLTPRRLLRIRTYPCFTMSLKLEAIPASRRPPATRARAPPAASGRLGRRVRARRGGGGREVGGRGGGGGGGFTGRASLSPRPPTRTVGGRLAATSGERGERGAARLGRRRQLTRRPARQGEERRLLRDPALPQEYLG